MNIFKKLLPFQQQQPVTPLHAGEIYYMWEGLTSGYKIIEVIETYLMNSEDTELQVFLTGIIQGIKATRINRIEKLLKNEGFTLPPHPATKLYQGNPGSGQDVKLSDDEILLNIVSWGQTLLLNNAKAVGAYTRESVRKIFTDLLLNEIKAYKLIVNFGKRRKVFSMPPRLRQRIIACTWERCFFSGMSSEPGI